MTKSKMFMAGALLVVATCGAFATKAVNRLITVYTVDAADGLCKQASAAIPPCTTDPEEFICKKNFGSGLTTVFQTTDAAGKCINPFKTDVQP